MNWTGFRIWLFALLFNGMITGVWFALKGELIMFFVGAIATVIMGTVISAPVIVVVMLMVDLAGKLPYSLNARIFWLFVMLSSIACLLLVLLEYVLDLQIHRKVFGDLRICLTLSVGLAVLLEAYSLKRRYRVIGNEQ